MIHNGRRKLPYDPEEALAHLRAKDPKLGALIDRVEQIGGFTLKLDTTGPPFTRCSNRSSTSSCTARLRRPFTNACWRSTASRTEPQALFDTPDEMLRAAGVSGNKIKALKDLAARTLDGTVPTHAAILKLSDAEIIERLTAVKGIGAWTVEMLLIFRLGRPDILPVSDYGVRKGFALTFQRVPKSRPLAAADLPKADVLLKRAKRWAPYRSVASWYMWRACDLAAAEKKLIPTTD
jgi:DNA-3-methyladenine glycosylase II